MSSIEIKQRLHQYIDRADERMAESLLAMFEKYFQNQKDTAVAFTAKGEPLTKEQLIKEVMEATEDIEKGNFLTTEEIRAQFKNKKN